MVKPRKQQRKNTQRMQATQLEEWKSHPFVGPAERNFIEGSVPALKKGKLLRLFPPGRPFSHAEYDEEEPIINDATHEALHKVLAKAPSFRQRTVDSVTKQSYAAFLRYLRREGVRPAHVEKMTGYARTFVRKQASYLGMAILHDVLPRTLPAETRAKISYLAFSYGLDYVPREEHAEAFHLPVIEEPAQKATPQMEEHARILNDMIKRSRSAMAWLRKTISDEPGHLDANDVQEILAHTESRNMTPFWFDEDEMKLLHEYNKNAEVRSAIDHAHTETERWLRAHSDAPNTQRGRDKADEGFKSLMLRWHRGQPPQPEDYDAYRRYALIQAASHAQAVLKGTRVLFDEIRKSN